MILPQFPLQLVVFPREKINLHIFEDRYKRLIEECKTAGATFGILPYLNGRMADHGTEVRLDKIHEIYEDGRMDIACRGLQIYRINKFDTVPPDQGYSSADVTTVNSNEESTLETRQETAELLERLTQKLSSPLTFDVDAVTLHSSQIVHKLGLSLDKELDLLKLLDEEKRLKHICAYLREFIPHLDKADEIRRRIKLNGHFKRLDPLDF